MYKAYTRKRVTPCFILPNVSGKNTERADNVKLFCKASVMQIK